MYNDHKQHPAERRVPTLPEEGYLRLSQIIGTKKTVPPTPAIIPISRTTIYQWIKDGKFPPPVKLGERVSAWRVRDIRIWLESGGESCV